MKKILLGITTFFLMALVMGAFLHNGALASTCDNSSDSSNVYNYTAAANCPPTLSEMATVIAVVVNAILAVSVLVFFIVLVVNGFNFITSLGTPEKIESARKGLLFSVLGFGLIFFSFVVVNIIINVTGLRGGITISGGNIKFNLISSVTPSESPAYINTATPTPSS